MGLVAAAKPKQQNEQPETGRKHDDHLWACHGDEDAPRVEDAHRGLRPDRHAGQGAARTVPDP
jgi:hypothetical protein